MSGYLIHWKLVEGIPRMHGENGKSTDIYLKATGASDEPEVVKVGLLLNHVGDKCIDVYVNFEYSESENKGELKTVLKK